MIKKSNKPRVYIASPYTKGDPCINTNFQCRMFDSMMNTGLVWPIIPLWCHFQHTAFPRPYEDWIAYDLAIIDSCDAIIRLNASGPNGYLVTESSGADSEVAYAKDLGIPVFYNIENLNIWALDFAKGKA